MKKDKKKRKIKLRDIFLVVGVFVLLAVVLFNVNNNNLKAHCKKAVCNESKTICSNYRLDKNGNTIKTWQGSCVKK